MQQFLPRHMHIRRGPLGKRFDKKYVVDTMKHLQPVLHDWCNKGRGMCYPVCVMVHIKEPLLLNVKRVAYVAAAGFLSHYQNGP